MLDAIGVGSVDDLFAEIPAELRLGRDLELPRGTVGDRVLRSPRVARGAQRRRRLRALLPRRRHVRPLRAGDRRRDHPALGVPDPVHALPARGLPGRAPGDVRVPDRDLGADAPAGRERLPLRGAVVGGLGRLPGDRRHRAPPPGRLAGPPSAQPRDASHLRARLRRRGGRGRASRAGSRTPASSRRRSTPTPPPCSSRTRTSSARSRTSRPSRRGQAGGRADRRRRSTR